MSDKTELEKVEYRQSQTEREIKAVVETLATISTKFTHLESLVSTLFRKLEHFAEKLSAHQKTPWPTLISFAGLVFIILSAVLAPLYFRISTLENEVVNMKNIDLTQADLNGYERAQLEMLMGEREQ